MVYRSTVSIVGATLYPDMSSHRSISQSKQLRPCLYSNRLKCDTRFFFGNNRRTLCLLFTIFIVIAVRLHHSIVAAPLSFYCAFIVSQLQFSLLVSRNCSCPLSLIVHILHQGRSFPSINLSCIVAAKLPLYCACIVSWQHGSKLQSLFIFCSCIYCIIAVDPLYHSIVTASPFITLSCIYCVVETGFLYQYMTAVSLMYSIENLLYFSVYHFIQYMVHVLYTTVSLLYSIEHLLFSVAVPIYQYMVQVLYHGLFII